MSIRRLSIACLLTFTSLLYSQEESNDQFRPVRELLADEIFFDEDNDFEREKNAFAEVQRELYINGDYRSIAYKDMPVPEGRGLIQPSPSMIGDILKNARIQTTSRVLVLGRNTEYLNEILSRLTVNLYVIDEDLQPGHSENYFVKNEWKIDAWSERAPFNVIVLFGSLKEIPLNVLAQLGLNGRLIISMEGVRGNQILMKAEKFDNGFTLHAVGESYIHELTLPD